MNRIRYLLDTDTCIFIRRHKPESVLARLSAVGLDAVALSAVTLYELAYGAEKHPHPVKAREQLRRFLHPFQILPWSDQVAFECAKIRARLEIRGQMIGHYDVQIAAHARCHGLTVVTTNEGEFRRVDGRRLENWCTPSAP